MALAIFGDGVVMCDERVATRFLAALADEK